MHITCHLDKVVVTTSIMIVEIGTKTETEIMIKTDTKTGIVIESLIEIMIKTDQGGNEQEDNCQEGNQTSK
jgi:hypothetical protein